jgi:hypothetical protein
MTILSNLFSIGLYTLAVIGLIFVILNIRSFYIAFRNSYRQARLEAMASFPHQIEYIKKLTSKLAVRWDRLSRFFAYIGLSGLAAKYAKKVEDAYEVIRIHNEQLIQYYDRINSYIENLTKFSLPDPIQLKSSDILH